MNNRGGKAMGKIRYSVVLCIIFVRLFAQGGGNLIDLGSSGDNYINCGAPASLEISTAVTVELWIYPTSFDAVANEVYAKFGSSRSCGASTEYMSHSIELRNGMVFYRISHNGVSPDDKTGSTLSLNTWYHLVLCFVDDTLKGYINGKLDGSWSSIGSIYTSQSIPFLIGDYYYCTYPFRGKIDEVRVWNATLSETTIRNWMHKEVTSSHPNYSSNLKGYWKLNESSGMTAYDASGNSADGTLVNACTWAVSTAPLGNEGAYVNTTDQTSVGPSGGQIKVTITSTPGDANNLGVYQFGSVSGEPVTGETYPGGIDKRSNIVWGITERGSVTANLVFDYSNVGGIGDPSTIKLLKRTDASSTTWDEVTVSSRDNNTRTITVEAVTSFSEFALGAGSDNSLPVTFSSFSAKIVSDGVALSWATESELENLGFNIYRKSVGVDFILIADFRNHSELKGHGSATEANHYLITDHSVTPGMTYAYLLSDVNYAGIEKKHTDQTVTVTIPASQTAIAEDFRLGDVYPNPFNAVFTIPLTLGKPAPVKLTLCDLNGKVVKVISDGVKPAGEYRIAVDCRELSSGIYFLHSTILEVKKTTKMVLIK